MAYSTEFDEIKGMSLMAADNIRGPLTEPSIVPDVLLTGATIEMSEHVCRITGWTDLPPGEPKERRVVVRLVLPIDVAKELFEGLTKNFRRKGSH